MIVDKRRLAIGMILVGFCVLFYFPTLDPRYEGLGADQSPMFFPRLVLLLMGGLSLISVVSSVGKGAGAGTIDANWARVGAAVVVIGAAIYLFQVIGFTLSSIIAFFAISVVLGYRRLKILAPIAIAYVLVIWATFTLAINVNLPVSPWFDRI